MRQKKRIQIIVIPAIGVGISIYSVSNRDALEVYKMWMGSTTGTKLLKRPKVVACVEEGEACRPRGGGVTESEFLTYISSLCSETRHSLKLLGLTRI